GDAPGSHWRGTQERASSFGWAGSSRFETLAALRRLEPVELRGRPAEHLAALRLREAGHRLGDHLLRIRPGPLVVGVVVRPEEVVLETVDELQPDGVVLEGGEALADVVLAA